MVGHTPASTAVTAGRAPARASSPQAATVPFMCDTVMLPDGQVISSTTELQELLVPLGAPVQPWRSDLSCLCRVVIPEVLELVGLSCVPRRSIFGSGVAVCPDPRLADPLLVLDGPAAGAVIEREWGSAAHEWFEESSQEVTPGPGAPWVTHRYELHANGYRVVESKSPA